MDIQGLKAKVNQCQWYHKIDLGYGITTPGWAPIDPTAYKVPQDLTGKRVLDVGAWDGYWTFEALKRNASQVIAIDDFSDQLGVALDCQSLPVCTTEWATFDLCKDALGYGDNLCQRFTMSVYDLEPSWSLVGPLTELFDVVFAFGLLYHCRHPLLALDCMQSVLRHNGEIFIESAILDDFSAYKGFTTEYANQTVAEFYPEDQYGANKTNWWVPSLTCLTHMVASAGFTDITAWKLQEHPTEVPYCRGFIHGIRE
jgi:tRNA (mo5U34)-methyltransferase